MQLGANLAALRHAAGLSLSELAGRSGLTETTIFDIEAGAHTAGTLTTLRLAGSLHASIDRLTAGVFWNPAEVELIGDGRKPGSERFQGYFSTRPAHMAGDEERPRLVVADSAQVATIIGRNLRDARRRRNLPQHGLGLKQSHVSRIERGLVEPALGTLIGRARELEIPIAALFAGMRWGEVAATTGAPGRRRAPRSLDAVVARHCREGDGIPAIARALAVPESTVRRVVVRLHREGRNLGPVGALTVADVADELALRSDEETRAGDPVGEEEVRSAIGEAIHARRERLGHSRTRLAEACGLTDHHTLFEFERRGPTTSITYLIRIAASLRAPCSTLTGGARWDPAGAAFLLDRDRERPHEPAAAIIGRNARAIRQAAGLSEAAIARRVGKRGRYFNRLERGLSVPMPITLLMLAGALGEAGPDALFEGICDWYVRPLLPVAISEADEATERKAAQVRLLRLWDEGSDLQSMGEAVDMEPGTAFAALDRLRALGVDVPYRKAPTGPAQLAARMRRRRLSRPLVDR
jgi:transcriptional regulator with XRE-family HTH domain